MSISFEPEGTRRILATLTPGERWERFEAKLEAELDRHPEWANRDWIIDDHGPLDDISVAGMARAARLFRHHTAGARTHTVVVTTDPYFAPWARVMDHHFRTRTHHAAPTLAAARALLDRIGPETSR